MDSPHIRSLLHQVLLSQQSLNHSLSQLVNEASLINTSLSLSIPTNTNTHIPPPPFYSSNNATHTIPYTSPYHPPTHYHPTPIATNLHHRHSHTNTFHNQPTPKSHNQPPKLPSVSVSSKFTDSSPFYVPNNNHLHCQPTPIAIKLNLNNHDQPLEPLHIVQPIANSVLVTSPTINSEPPKPTHVTATISFPFPTSLSTPPASTPISLSPPAAKPTPSIADLTPTPPPKPPDIASVPRTPPLKPPDRVPLPPLPSKSPKFATLTENNGPALPPKPPDPCAQILPIEIQRAPSRLPPLKPPDRSFRTTVEVTKPINPVLKLPPPKPPEISTFTIRNRESHMLSFPPSRVIPGGLKSRLPPLTPFFSKAASSVASQQKHYQPSDPICLCVTSSWPSVKNTSCVQI